MVITVAVVRKAIMGAHIRINGELYAHYGRVPPECIEAARSIIDNYAEFENLAWAQFKSLPKIHYFFGRLIRNRLRQEGILDSPIISAIFDEGQSLEQRLVRIQSIPGVDHLRKEYRGSSQPYRGNITDEAIVDVGAEIVVLDYLINLNFSSIRKVISEANRPHVDILAERDNRKYAIEVTRKREIRSWKSVPYGNLEDCDSPSNQDLIRKSILRALARKEKQFGLAEHISGLNDTVVRVVGIKTSDYAFAECIDQVKQIAQEILAEENNWEHIDCIWLVPNTAVAESRWVCKRAANTVLAQWAHLA